MIIKQLLKEPIAILKKKPRGILQFSTQEAMMLMYELKLEDEVELFTTLHDIFIQHYGDKGAIEYVRYSDLRKSIN